MNVFTARRMQKKKQREYTRWDEEELKRSMKLGQEIPCLLGKKTQGSYCKTNPSAKRVQEVAGDLLVRRRHTMDWTNRSSRLTVTYPPNRHKTLDEFNRLIRAATWSLWKKQGDGRSCSRGWGSDVSTSRMLVVVALKTFETLCQICLNCNSSPKETWGYDSAMSRRQQGPVV
ncbi:hypothetical protein B0O99DRAFT_118659 [Bisporella sp. PMI_857]|nr:hypothetical protein B0O99DRAFT_118659 [Bisporella sp. PMI_857]